MAKETVTKGMSGNGKMKQEYINVVEKRLSFSGGTLLVEIGAAIAERYGEGKTMVREHKRIVTHNAVKMELYQAQLSDRIAQGPPKAISTDEARKKITDGTFENSFTIVDRNEIAKLREQGMTQFSKERAQFSEMAKAYIEEAYGVEIRDQFGKLINYGERVEVLKNSHLRKIW